MGERGSLKEKENNIYNIRNEDKLNKGIERLNSSIGEWGKWEDLKKEEGKARNGRSKEGIKTYINAMKEPTPTLYGSVKG